jgi:hypothetical protein
MLTVAIITIAGAGEIAIPGRHPFTYVIIIII